MTDKEKLDIALYMLASWCLDVELNGTGWDDWDENYKDAAYREGPLRRDIDQALAVLRAKDWRLKND